MRYKFVDEAPDATSGGRFKLVSEEKSEVPEQLTKSTIESLGGTYGSIADLLGIQTKEKLLPGQRARAEMEAKATPEELINLASDSDILPDYARLPSAEEIRELTGRKEPKTASGRFAARSGSAVGSTLAMGGGLGATGTSVAGSQAGQAMREMGAPESIAMGTDIATSLASGATPSLLKRGEILRKPSGTSVRKFETLKKPVKVSASVKERVAEKVEEDLRSAATKIMEGNKTFRGMKEFPDFEQKLYKAFDDARELAKDIKEPINTGKIRQEYAKMVREKTKEKFMPSEEQKAYAHYSKQYMKDFPEEERSVLELEKKYRQNNKDLGKIRSMNRTPAQLEAKAEAIRDKNIAIEKVFESDLPDHPFTKLFKFNNAVHTDMKNVQLVDSFIDKVTSKGIDYKTAQDFFKSRRIPDAITKTFGKEASNQFSGLMGELVSQKEAMKLLRTAQDSGVNLVGLQKYLFHPSAGVLPMVKNGFKYLAHRSLANPVRIKDWRKGIGLIKQGSFAEGARILKELDKEMDQSSKTE